MHKNIQMNFMNTVYIEYYIFVNYKLKWFLLQREWKMDFCFTSLTKKSRAQEAQEAREGKEAQQIEEAQKYKKLITHTISSIWIFCQI